MAEIHMLFRRYFRFAIHFFTFGFFIFLKLINVFRARILTALRMVIGGISHGILLATAAFGIVVGIFSTALFAQTCTVGSAVGSYGTVDVLPGLAVPASTSFTVNCTGTAGNIVRLCINISYGTSANLSTSPRIMTSGTNNLNHELYIDSGHGTIFGSPLNPYFQTYAGTFVQYDVTIGAGGSTTTPPFNVYGQVLGSQQTALPGTYNWNTGTPGVQYAIKTATANRQQECHCRRRFQHLDCNHRRQVQPLCHRHQLWLGRSAHRQCGRDRHAQCAMHQHHSLHRFDQWRP